MPGSSIRRFARDVAATSPEKRSASAWIQLTPTGWRCGWLQTASLRTRYVILEPTVHGSAGSGGSCQILVTLTSRAESVNSPQGHSERKDLSAGYVQPGVDQSPKATSKATEIRVTPEQPDSSTIDGERKTVTALFADILLRSLFYPSARDARCNSRVCRGLGRQVGVKKLERDKF
jgi:hypothetical protein